MNRLFTAILCALMALPTFAVSAQDETGTQVFGEWMFSGKFAEEPFSGFNPGYQIGVGDKIALKLWGAYEYEDALVVDARGNVFIPKVGPVNVLGVRNDRLNSVIEARVKRVYQQNVGVYANLDTAQPVKVYVTGFVEQPGLYSGLSSDSVLYYLDKAGGIDTERGSFLEVRVERNGKERKQLNLYDFLLNGELGGVQFVDGDTIIVGPRRHSILVQGLVQNPFHFEFSRPVVSVGKVLDLARINPEATHLRVTRNSGRIRNTEYYALDQIEGLSIYAGDEVTITADKKPGTISVRVEGEHESEQEFVLPYGSRLGDLMEKIQFSPRSDAKSIQLYRRSIKTRQKEMLNTSLQSLEASVLTARSATNDEAQLRNHEAELVLQWIERAKNIETRGQVVLADTDEWRNVLLENGDIVRIPPKSALVMVHGEVMFPNAMVYRSDAGLEGYLANAGGYTQNADVSQILVLHRDGSFSRAEKGGWGKKLSADIRPGDEILVLPKIDVKNLQITKDVTQILYQIAVSAAVVIGI